MSLRSPETHHQKHGTAILAAIAIGALLGTTARFAIGKALPGVGPGALPLGTLLVNLTGCWLIGVVQTLFRQGRVPHAHLLQPGITVGVLGGFTTFSTFSVETIRLLQAGFVGRALAYQTFSLFGGLGAVMLGITVGQRLARTWWFEANR